MIGGIADNPTRPKSLQAAAKLIIRYLVPMRLASHVQSLELFFPRFLHSLYLPQHSIEFVPGQSTQRATCSLPSPRHPSDGAIWPCLLSPMPTCLTYLTSARRSPRAASTARSRLWPPISASLPYYPCSKTLRGRQIYRPRYTVSCAGFGASGSRPWTTIGWCTPRSSGL